MHHTTTQMSLNQRIFQVVDSGELPSADLADAVRKVQEARAKARARAEKFGTEYQEPSLFDVLSVTEAKRLALQKEAGTISGVDSVDESDERRKARAERFGVTPFTFQDEAMRMAGLTEDEIRLRKERRERAAKFGVDDELDVAIAKAALEALGPARGSSAAAAAPSADASAMATEEGAVASDDAIMFADEQQAAVVADIAAGSASGSSSSAMIEDAGADADDDPSLPALVPRPTAIHLCVGKYLPAASGDIMAFFSHFRPSFVEWLNGRAVNVLFEDAATAKRALECLSEPIPRVKGVAPVDPAWRVCLKPLEKRRTDKYAVAGSSVTVYLRPATSHDTKELVGGSEGPRTHGTFSHGGTYSAAPSREVVTSKGGSPPPRGRGGAGGSGGGLIALEGGDLSRVGHHVTAVLKRGAADLYGPGDGTASSQGRQPHRGGRDMDLPLGSRPGPIVVAKADREKEITVQKAHPLQRSAGAKRGRGMDDAEEDDDGAGGLEGAGGGLTVVLANDRVFKGRGNRKFGAGSSTAAAGGAAQSAGGAGSQAGAGGGGQRGQGERPLYVAGQGRGGKRQRRGPASGDVEMGGEVEVAKAQPAAPSQPPTAAEAEAKADAAAAAAAGFSDAAALGLDDL